MSRTGLLRRIEPVFAFHDAPDADGEGFAAAFARGMRGRRKALPCKFLYDATGSALFDRICELPEYYPTRAEASILAADGRDLGAAIGPRATLIELGSGSSFKTRLLLDRMIAPAGYVPVDVSADHLKRSAFAIARDYPGLAVEAVCADFTGGFNLPLSDGRPVAFFPGSTIGNFTAGAATALLRRWAGRLGRGGLMIVGVDLKKSRAVLEAAYDDAAGVTEAFIRNILVRANRELGAGLDLGAFDYRARYAAQPGRVEMHLVSRTAQSFSIGGEAFRLGAGERIHIEHSHKYTVDGFRRLASAAGFSSRDVFLDKDALFSVHLLKVA